MTARLTPNVNNGVAFMGFAITGTGGRDCSVAATCDAQALVRDLGGNGDSGYIQASATYFVTGLSAGSHTFTALYRETGGTAAFANRNIIVIPMP